MNACSLVYVTAENEAQAVELGRTVVVERLAACANILPGMRSIYRWQDALEEASEAVLLLKTADTRAAALVERLLELHPYDCPCVVTVPLSGGNPDFLRWIRSETEPQ